MDFDFRLLSYAVAVCDCRNFGRAAKELHISQPSLSRAIQQLEGKLGTPIFDRTTLGPVPTDSGGLFLEHARELLSRAADLGREMDLLKGVEKGDLLAGVGTFPLHAFVDRAVTRLVREHPTIHISVITDNWAKLLPPLRRREIDLAVIDVSSIETEQDLHITRLNSHQGYYVMRSGHPLLKGKRNCSVAETWNYPVVFISRVPPNLFKGIIKGLLESLKFKGEGPKTIPSVSCESTHMMKTIVLGSDAIAMLGLNSVAEEVERGELVAIPGPEWLRAHFGIVRLAHRSPSPLGEAFAKLVKEADAELFDWEQKTSKSLFSKKSSKRRRQGTLVS
jgi:DNA-binding transcriptional LysR family regulator